LNTVSLCCTSSLPPPLLLLLLLLEASPLLHRTIVDGSARACR
jgi:hypothetical protein